MVEEDTEQGGGDLLFLPCRMDQGGEPGPEEAPGGFPANLFHGAELTGAGITASGRFLISSEVRACVHASACACVLACVCVCVRACVRVCARVCV